MNEKVHFAIEKRKDISSDPMWPGDITVPHCLVNISGREKKIGQIIKETLYSKYKITCLRYPNTKFHIYWALSGLLWVVWYLFCACVKILLKKSVYSEQVFWIDVCNNTMLLRTVPAQWRTVCVSNPSVQTIIKMWFCIWPSWLHNLQYSYTNSSVWKLIKA